MAGLDSVVLTVIPTNTTWTATANDTWLHLSLANQSGVGRTNVVFSYDANPGGTRSGTLTIGGQTLTVTQAGSTYVPAGVITVVAEGLGAPSNLAVDGQGNLFILEGGAVNTLQKWTAARNTLTTLVSSGLVDAEGIAVDGAGDVYIGDTETYLIQKWTPPNTTLSTLASSTGLGWEPGNVAVDGAGNVYFSDHRHDAIDEWEVDSGHVVTLWQGTGPEYGAAGVAVDSAGNVYIADTATGVISEWSPETSSLTTLVTNDHGSEFLALDLSGNLYMADPYSSDALTHSILKWLVAEGTVSTLVSLGSDLLYGVTVDSGRNVYFLDSPESQVKEVPCAFVDPTPKLEGLAAGSDVMPAVVPGTENLLGLFAPTSDQPWLTITGITNGVVSFAFTATTANRTGNIKLLGLTIPITQGGPSYSLNAARAPGGAGGDSIASF